IRLCDGVRYQQVADEGIVLRQTEGTVLVLNEVGMRVLALLDKGVTVPELVDRLAAEFDAEAGRLAADVAGFVAELRTAGIIEEGAHP
ncbi:MAG: PqqD family protein, partial [Chromatiaceae bacterium]